MDHLSLVQRSLPFGKLTLTVESNRELIVKHGTLFRATSQTFPLGLIDPSPIHHRSVPVGWVIFTVLFSLGVLGALIDGWLFKGPGEMFGLLLVSTVFLACLYNTIQLSSNTLHYRNANTSAVLFSMFRSRPSRASVDSFITELKNQIESFRIPAGVSEQELATVYRKHLDFLLEKEVLLREEYDIIVQRLQEKSARKRVFELVR